VELFYAVREIKEYKNKLNVSLQKNDPLNENGIIIIDN